MTDKITSIGNIAIGLLPSILALIRERAAAVNPGAPALTNEDAIAGLAFAVTSSVAKDHAWKAAYPA